MHVLRARDGLTLVELLIVVTVVSVLAAVAIPRFATSSADAKTAALRRDLRALNSAVELYRHQHRGVYPGLKKASDGTDVASAAEARIAFERQLLFPSNASGITSTERDAAHPYGPYLKAIPENPVNGLATVVVDFAETDLNLVVPDATNSGWKAFARLGLVIANDEGAADRGTDFKDIFGGAIEESAFLRTP